MPNNLGNQLLFHAVAHSNPKDTITLLEEREAEVNARNINGSTPLHQAIQTQNLTLVQILLKYGADPSICEFQDIGGCSPLHRAVENNNFQLTQILLEYGANPSQQSKNGFTPLHVAARHGHIDLVKLLVAAGSDLYLRDVNGYSASYWAKINKHVEIMELLPPPQCIEPDDLYQFKMQLREIHDITVKLPKGKKKKKKK